MANDFGVVTGDVAAMSQGLTFTASTTPTATQAQAVIDEHGEYVSAIFWDQLVTASALSSSSQGYRIGRMLVRYRSVIELATAQHHTIEQVDIWERRADALEEQLRTHVGTLGESSSTDKDAPGRLQTSHDYEDEIDDNVADAGDLAAQMARGRYL